MALPDLSLSLQFGRFDGVARHRAALPRHRVARCIRHALALPGELTVRIVDAEEGQRLNREFRGKDYATNVLTFDYARENAGPPQVLPPPPGGGSAPGRPWGPPSLPMVMADLVLCAPVVAREARELRVTLADHYAHLLVHGTLHAQGWDHETGEADAEAMEAREIEILAGLGVRNPYRR